MRAIVLAGGMGIRLKPHTITLPKPLMPVGGKMAIIEVIILLIGSSAEYGVPETKSGYVSENHPLKPVSVYGFSKVFQTRLMNYFQRKPGIKIVMARVFNLDGDGISPLLFPGRVRTEIKNYLAKKTMSIQVGDLSACVTISLSTTLYWTLSRSWSMERQAKCTTLEAVTR